MLSFTTSGEGMEVYQEGMVELLATNLDGLGDIRTIDSCTVLAHLAEWAGDLDPAAWLFEEEAWRGLGPAATYRLARIRERQG